MSRIFKSESLKEHKHLKKYKAPDITNVWMSPAILERMLSVRYSLLP